MSDMVNMYELFGVDDYMTGLGLCADPAYQGQGLGLALLEAQTEMCKAIDLTVSVVIFTAAASQNLAERAGMKVLKEIFYEDLKEDDGTLAYPNIKCKSFKIMTKNLL